jgi:hypothetical protein
MWTVKIIFRVKQKHAHVKLNFTKAEKVSEFLLSKNP